MLENFEFQHLNQSVRAKNHLYKLKLYEGEYESLMILIEC
jgi:hypothetical protein